MESPGRSRLDQFFPAKKRRRSNPPCSSACSSDIVHGKHGTESSPSKKGSLENLLISTRSELPISMKPVLDVHCRHAVSNKCEIKRPSGHSCGCEEEQQRTHFLLQKCSNDGSFQLTPSKEHVKGKSSTIVGGQACSEETFNKLDSEEDQVSVHETRRSVNEQFKFDLASKTQGKLSQFASDFLSLCCSGYDSMKMIPQREEQQQQDMTEIEVTFPLDAENCNKAMVGSKNEFNQSHRNQCGIVIVSPSEEKRSKITARGALKSNNSMELDTSNVVTELSSPHRLQTPTLSKNETRTLGVSGLTPQISCIKRLGRTPGSVFRNSLFSPGDAFWDEAIQVVDGLKLNNCNDDTEAGLKNLNKLHLNHSEAENNMTTTAPNREHDVSLQKSDKNLTALKCSEKNEEDMLITDCLTGSQPDSVEDQEKARRMQNANGRVAFAKPEGLQVSESAHSPLPIRHFDFSSQENLSKNRIEPRLKDDAFDANPVDTSCSRPVEQLISNDPPKSGTERLHGHVGNPANSDSMQECSLEKAALKSMNEAAKAESLQSIQVDSTEIKVMDESSATQKERLRLHISEDDESLSHKGSKPLDQKADVTSHALYNCRKDAAVFQLSHWLPDKLCDMYSKKGIKMLYPWQVECLQLSGVLEGKNLVYCASTSAGKSLVAEILMLRKVILTEKRALLILPYVSLCSEKAEHLESLLEPVGKRVRSFFGSQGSATLPKDTSVAVCTIEKANSLINRLLEEGRLPELAVVVIDELHMVGDKERGYLLELMLTKLQYAAGGGASITGRLQGSPSIDSRGSDQGTNLQIVGMSATMPNVAAVASWLQAAFYETDFRPVPLEQFIKVGNAIYNNKMEVVRIIRKGADLGGKDPDHVVELCQETVQDGHSVLLFCSSRKACEISAKHVARYLSTHSGISHAKKSPFRDGADAIEELRKCPAGLDPILAETLPAGVAFHHAGLTIEERDLVETCYRSGIVRILTATSTLAAGVNLPARRVIFRQPRIGRDFIDGIRYRQMAGRAGRAGIDTRGESFVICKPEEVKRVALLLSESCQPLQSCLAEDKNGMTRAILEVVAGGIVQTANDVNRYVRCTLLNSTQPFQEVVSSAQESLHWLCLRKFLEWDNNTEVYTVTPLGKAAFGSSLSPEESLVVFEDLAKARESFVLASDLHLLYQITPTHVELEPDWGIYYQKFSELSHIDQLVGNRVGVMEPFLMRMAHGAPLMEVQSRKIGRSPRGKGGSNSSFTSLGGRIPGAQMSVDKMLRIFRRFYVALILAKLVQEIPLVDVCEAFKVARGTVQALQDSAGRFAAMISAFCERLGWHDLEGLVSKFQNRVSFGVRAEIVELTEIPFVKAARARALFKSGLRNAQAVAEASLSELVKALFEASSWAAQDGSRSVLQYRIQMGVAKKIKNGARQIVLDKAEAARTAAFSAYQALGLDIPPALSLPVEMRCDKLDLTEGTGVSSIENEKLDPDLNDAKRVQGQADGTSFSDLQVVKLVPEINEVEKLHDYGEFSFKEKGRCPTTEVLPKGANTNINQGESSLFKYPLPASGYCDRRITEIIHPHGRDKGPVDVDDMEGGFSEFLLMWQKTEEYFFDIHYSKYSMEDADPLFEVNGIAVCWNGSPIYYVSSFKGSATSLKKAIDAKLSDTRVDSACLGNDLARAKEKWEKIGAMFSQKGQKKVTWDWKSQSEVFRYPGVCVIPPKSAGIILISNAESGIKKDLQPLMPIDIKEPPIDLCIVSWLLWPDEQSSQNPSLEKEVKKRLPGELAAKASRDGRWTNQMGRVAHNGCCRRAAQIRALHSVIWKLLIAEGLEEPLMHLEMPLVPVLADMETWGIYVDMSTCIYFRSVLERKKRDLETRAQHLAGMPFALSAPAEVANVLYGQLKLPVPVGCNKGKQHHSTDKQVLDSLRHLHPIVDVIKEHRSLSKLLHSTLGSIMTWAKPLGTMKEHGTEYGRYHIKGHWLQTSTATGRLSMEEPNLQCVEHSVRFTVMEEATQSMEGSSANSCEVNPRDIFVPSQENWVLMSADYSQIEVRLMAHFSKDPLLLEVISRPTGDLFQIIASQWMGKEETEITEKQREQAKRLVYGILYGMGVNALAEHLECSVSEAADKYDQFRAAFPGVVKWLKQAVEDCRLNGFIKTLAGRKRFLEKINHKIRNEKAKAERQAVNSICQGSAADLIKVAMVMIHSVITGDMESVSNSHAVSGILGQSSLILKDRCRMLLQIHDELLLEVDQNVLKEAGAVVRSCMENAASLNVPLRVKLQVGRKWGSLHAFDERASAVV